MAYITGLLNSRKVQIFFFVRIDNPIYTKVPIGRQRVGYRAT